MDQQLKDILAHTKLSLSWLDRRRAIKALHNIQSLQGIGDMGPRAAEMETRFKNKDTTITTPEFITLGFALSRLDTPAGYKLLSKLQKKMVA